MAIYHFSAKIVARSAGRSAIAAAAHRSASALLDDRLDRVHDFSAKTDVIHSEVMLLDGAPARLADRTKLWKEVERAEVPALAVARNLYKLMAYMDEYEVARLYTDGRFVENLKAQFEGDYRLEFNLAPPIFAKRDPVTGHLRKQAFWALDDVGISPACCRKAPA